MSNQGMKFTFVLEFKGVEGFDKCLVSRAEYEEFKDEPLKLVALKLGVSVDKYLRWVELDGYVQCISKTQKKTQCKNMIPLRFYNCKEWAEANKAGGYCAIHGGN